MAGPDVSQYLPHAMARPDVRQYLRHVTAYLLLIVAIATLGPLQFGFHIAELNAPQAVITCRQKPSASNTTRLATWAAASRSDAQGGPALPASFPDCIPMDEAAFATISSIFTLGAFASALAAGRLSSKRGRLPTMRVTSVLYAVCSLIEALAASVWVMSLGRFISGLGAGASTVIVPLYISEVSSPSHRGLFGAMTQVSINVGILFTQKLGYFLSHPGQWRWILGAGLCIAAAQAVGLMCVPESPPWLAAHGDASAGERTLRRIRGKGSDVRGEMDAWGCGPETPVTPEEQALLAEADAAGRAPAPSTAPRTSAALGFAKVAMDPRHRPAIVAVVGVMFAQQLCGINAVIMYSVSLFSDMFPTSSTLLTIVISAVNLVMTAACAPLPDRLGRRTCLLISIVGQGTSALALAFSVVFGVRLLSVVAVLGFVGFFAVGLGPVPFVLASELADPEAAGATQSWGLGANFTATYFVAQFFPIVNARLNRALGGQGWTFFLFAAFAAVSALFVLLRVPETRGRRDADDVWGRNRRVD